MYEDRVVARHVTGVSMVLTSIHILCLCKQRTTVSDRWMFRRYWLDLIDTKLRLGWIEFDLRVGSDGMVGLDWLQPQSILFHQAEEIAASTISAGHDYLKYFRWRH